MHGFIARENVDHYLALLRDGKLPDERRKMVCKLLIEEEDKLAQELENIGFAEERAQRARQHLLHIRGICGETADGESRVQAERLLAAAEEAQRLLDKFCDTLRQRSYSRGL